MVWYRDIQPQQEPIDAGLDEAKRQQYSFNVLVTKRPSDTLLDELVAIQEGAGVGTRDVTIFTSAKATIPAGAGPYLSLRPNGGPGPLGTHNAGVAAYRRHIVQALARAQSPAAALAMANAAYNAFAAVRNQEISA